MDKFIDILGEVITRWLWFIFWMMLWCISLAYSIARDIDNTGLDKSYVWEKVNVMTEDWLKEMRVHYRKQDLYTDVYYLSNAEYWTYDACGEDCSWYFKYPIMKDDLIQLLN